MVYIYLIGAAIYGVIWAALFISKKEIRIPMLAASMLGIPLSLAEKLFTEYWIPAFDVIRLHENWYLGDVLFCFFNAGVIVGVLYLIRQPIRRLPAIAYSGLILCAGLYILDPLNTTFMNYLLISLAPGAAFVLWVMPKRDRAALIKAGLINWAAYMALFAALWFIFPELKQSYLFGNLWGINVFTIPLEEYLWILGYAITWAPIYETIRPAIERLIRA